jgi:cell division septation protein DedD
VRNGAFVAQIAALQSQEGVEPLWRRLSSRAPDLFAQATMDIQTADLGPRGVYHRVRAGYFPDRANADRFCARMQAMGQDCVVAER